MLGVRDAAQNAALQEALAFLASPAAKDVGAVLDKVSSCRRRVCQRGGGQPARAANPKR